MKLNELQPLIDMAVASKWGDSEVVARFGDTYYSVSDFNPSNAEGTANHCEIVLEAREPSEAGKILAFLRDIESVCKRHNISIGHEDGHGCFLILDYDDPRGSFGEGAYYDKRKKVR